MRQPDLSGEQLCMVHQDLGQVWARSSLCAGGGALAESTTFVLVLLWMWCRSEVHIRYVAEAASGLLSWGNVRQPDSVPDHAALS